VITLHLTYTHHGEFEDLIVIESGEIYRGNLPKRKRKIATEYVVVNRDNLMEIFNQLNPQLLRK